MIFAVYKPKGPTSNDVLNTIRKICGTKQVGHAGTLDPLAEGVLVVGIGRDSTKKLSQVVAKEKEYVAEVYLGATSVTDDAEGEIIQNTAVQEVSHEAVETAAVSFQGTYKQVPPTYSAIKINGKEAYKRVRSGELVNMEAREAHIHEIEVLAYTWPVLQLRVVTGPGVYIRALARDIGEKLGTGAYLSSLIRTRVGEFRFEQSVRIENLKHYLNAHQQV